MTASESAGSNHERERSVRPVPHVWLALRWLAGLGALALAAGLAAHLLRPQVEYIGRLFVKHAGYAGMAFGTMLADGFQFPVPPQFYMLLAIASDGSDGWALVSITAGSLLGGVAGYLCARRLGQLRWFRRRLQSLQDKYALRDKLGPKRLIALGLSPIAFSWLVYFCGINRYRWRSVALLSALRIPKLLVYYWLVRAGWSY